MNTVTIVAVALIAVASVILGLFASLRAGLFAERGREDSVRANRVSMIALGSGAAMVVSVDILANMIFPLAS